MYSDVTIGIFYVLRIVQLCKYLYLLFLQKEMDRDHREPHDHDNLNENEEERKVGMDFRNLSRHHGMDHVADVETEVFISFLNYLKIIILILKCSNYFLEII